MIALLVALGAAIGAPLRFLCAYYLDRPFPRGTLLVNVAGSFVLGVCSALALSGSLLALVGTGFCGTVTTYSAFSVQTVTLGRRTGTVYAALTIILALLAATLGFALGAQA